MTTELVLLLGLFAFLVVGVVAKAPMDTFKRAGPHLGARIEQQIETGKSFAIGTQWKSAKE